MLSTKLGLSADAVDEVFFRVRAELVRGYRLHGRYSTLHHGHSVVLEKLDEMWDAIKADDPEQAIKEAIEVAATAIHLVIDLGG